MLVYVHEIAANITCYCRNVIGNSTHDTTFCRVLFGPSLTEALGHTDSYAKASSLLGLLAYSDMIQKVLLYVV